MARAVNKTVTLALTGASGMPYGIRLLECLLASGTDVWLLYSQVAQIVARSTDGDVVVQQLSLRKR